MDPVTRVIYYRAIFIVLTLFRMGGGGADSAPNSSEKSSPLKLFIHTSTHPTTSPADNTAVGVYSDMEQKCKMVKKLAGCTKVQSCKFW